MKVSLIVPIYNAEDYLKRCLDSIAKQTWRNFEVILVDDGSIDLSGSICDEYVNKYKYMHVIHKKNEGVIAARKTGLSNARYDVISFVDADDWIENYFLEEMVRGMETYDADMVAAGCIKEELCQKSQVLINKFKQGYYDKQALYQDVYPKMMFAKQFHEFNILPYLCNKLFKKNLLMKCYEGLDHSIDDGDDVAVVYPYILISQGILIQNSAYYHYEVHEGSITEYKKPDFYENVSKLYLHLKKEFKKSQCFDVLLPQLDQYMRKMIWLGNPVAFSEGELYILPFKKLNKDANIILYGAGHVGRSYYHQIEASGYCNVIAWVDRDAQKKEMQHLNVKSPDSIYDMTYDSIVVAIANDKIKQGIKETLMKQGVSESRIIL